MKVNTHFEIEVSHTPDYEYGEVSIFSSPAPPPFPVLMLATENIMNLAALSSGLSYDEAIDLLVVGAKTIKSKQRYEINTIKNVAA